jgi:hypothetical protein
MLAGSTWIFGQEKREKNPSCVSSLLQAGRTQLTGGMAGTYVPVLQQAVGVWLPTSLDLTLHYHPG